MSCNSVVFFLAEKPEAMDLSGIDFDDEVEETRSQVNETSQNTSRAKVR